MKSITQKETVLIKEVYIARLLIGGKQKVTIVGYVKLNQKLTPAFGQIPYSKFEDLLMGGGQTGLSVLRKVNDIWKHPHSPTIEINLHNWFGKPPLFKTDMQLLKTKEEGINNKFCYIKLR